MVGFSKTVNRAVWLYIYGMPLLGTMLLILSLVHPPLVWFGLGVWVAYPMIALCANLALDAVESWHDCG